MNERKNTKSLAVGLIAALAASLCCIGPLLIAFVSISGSAIYFSWLESLRPYLLLIAIAALAFAWYQRLNKKSDCDCEEDAPRFFQTKSFLGVVTIIAVFFMAFPYYSGYFNSKVENKDVISIENLIRVEFEVDGMTCNNCENHVVSAINLLPGIQNSSASYLEGKAYATYDFSIISKEALAISIEKETGYKVLRSNVVND